MISVRYKSNCVFLFCLVLFVPALIFAQADTAFICGAVQESIGVVKVDSVGIVKAVVIYACDTSASTNVLPSWWAQIWDSSKQLSVPRWYKDNSLGQLILNAVPYGRDSSHCFTSNIATAYILDGRDAYFRSFVHDIIVRADTVINFADFDNDGANGIPASQDSVGDDDGDVDALFFVVVNHGLDNGYWPARDDTTNDFSRTGTRI